MSGKRETIVFLHLPQAPLTSLSLVARHPIVTRRCSHLTDMFHFGIKDGSRNRPRRTD